MLWLVQSPLAVMSIVDSPSDTRSLGVWAEQQAENSGVPSCVIFFFSSRRRHTRLQGDWSSDVCSSDLLLAHRRARFLRFTFRGCDGTAAAAGAGSAFGAPSPEGSGFGALREDRRAG